MLSKSLSYTNLETQEDPVKRKRHVSLDQLYWVNRVHEALLVFGKGAWQVGMRKVLDGTKIYVKPCDSIEENKRG